MRVREYVKKPLVVRAVQWDGTVEEADAIIDWVRNNGGGADYLAANGLITLKTLGGWMNVMAGMYIIQRIKGEFYPHSGEFFDEVYEEVYPGTCEAELHSWHYYHPENIDSYWMPCDLAKGHSGEHENSETGARWNDA